MSHTPLQTAKHRAAAINTERQTLNDDVDDGAGRVALLGSVLVLALLAAAITLFNA